MFAWLLKLIGGGWIAAKHVAGHAAIHSILFNEGDIKKGMKPDVLRAIAPRFSKKQEDEAVVEGVAQRRLTGAERLALGNFRGRLGPNQRDHLSISLAQTHDSSQKLNNTGDDVVAGFLRDVINTDPPLADPDPNREDARHRARVRKCAERGFMHSDEESYPIGWLQGIAGRTFDSAEDMWGWLMEVPPVGTAPRWQIYQNTLTYAIDQKLTPIDTAVRNRLAAGPNVIGSEANSRQNLNNAQAAWRNRRR